MCLAKAGEHKGHKCCETERERESQSNGCDDDHTMSILALKIVCETLMSLPAAVSMSLVSFFMVNGQCW